MIVKTVLVLSGSWSLEWGATSVCGGRRLWGNSVSRGRRAITGRLGEPTQTIREDVSSERVIQPRDFGRSKRNICNLGRYVQVVGFSWFAGG